MNRSRLNYGFTGEAAVLAGYGDGAAAEGHDGGDVFAVSAA